MKTVCTFVAVFEDVEIAVSAVGFNQSESKLFLDTNLIADFLLNLNSNDKFEQPLSEEYLKQIKLARDYQNLSELQGLCSELRVQYFILFNQIDVGTPEVVKSKFLTKAQAQIRARRYSHRYLTYWYVREVKPGEFEPWAYSSDDAQTVTTFYCGEDWTDK